MKMHFKKLLEKIPVYMIFFLMAVVFSGCEIIGGIFKAGVWVGIIMVVLIISIVVYIMGKFKK